MSGGRSTVAFKRGKVHAHHSGDISATSAEGHRLTDHFYIECKSYRDLQFAQLITQGTGTLAKFWKTTVAGAKQYKRSPMMIVRQNQMPTVVLLPSNIFSPSYTRRITSLEWMAVTPGFVVVRLDALVRMSYPSFASRFETKKGK
jgi:hypothetical protein